MAKDGSDNESYHLGEDKLEEPTVLASIIPLSRSGLYRLDYTPREGIIIF